LSESGIFSSRTVNDFLTLRSNQECDHVVTHQEDWILSSGIDNV
jgi:hypothetical protein